MPDDVPYETFDPRLKKQIEEYLHGVDVNNPVFKQFLLEVNNTYHDLEVKNNGADARFRSIIERSSEILYNVGTTGYFTYVNPAAELTTGFRQAELLNKHFSELVRPDYRKAAIEFYTEQLAEKTPSTYYEFPIITKQGNELWVGQSVQLSESNTSGVEFTALVINITERKVYEQQLLRQKEKYQNIITNMNLGMIEVDLEERIQFSNHTFSLISGYSEQELTGKKASELLLSDQNRNLLKEKMRLREQGVSDMYEARVENKTGEERWWMVSGAPNYDATGKIIGSIGIHLDITEKKQMELELEAARLKSEESSRAKSAFLAHMSHEIRTPLNAIIGMIRELSYETLTPKQRGYVNNTSTASEHLLSVLNNVLDISKMETGELSLEHRHFILKETIKEVKAIMKMRAREKGLYFGLDVMDVNDVAYLGDPARIRQVLLNLIGNAIKFTDQGGVYVECKIKAKLNGSHTIALSVEDTGIGMEEAFQQQLFRKFSQEDASISRKYGGTGLGMAISQEIIKLMHGNVSVISKKNQGTRVEAVFDLRLGQADQIDHSTDTTNILSRKKTRVLLVEDNAFNRAVASSALRRHACKITEAVDGSEAIHLLKNEHFDVVLMDLQMPVMDGFEATRIIRQELHLNVPIIALTANAFKSELEQCLARGMNDYITKPFEEHKLISLVKQMAAHGWQPSVVIPVNNNTGEKLYNLDQLKHLGGDDPAFIQKMLRLFIEQALTSLQQMTEAYRQRDLAVIYALAHRLKPGIDSLALKTWQGPIRLLENKAKLGVDVPEIGEQINFLNTSVAEVIEQLQQELL